MRNLLCILTLIKNNVNLISFITFFRLAVAPLLSQRATCPQAEPEMVEISPAEAEINPPPFVIGESITTKW